MSEANSPCTVQCLAAKARPLVETSNRPGKSRLVNVAWKDPRHVDVNAEQLRSGLHPHYVGDNRPPVATLRHKLCVSVAAAQAAGGAPPPVSVPVGFTTFPGEIWAAPRSWVEMAYPNLAYFNEVDKGGHFAAWEEPGLFAAELRAAFSSLR